MSMFIKDQLEEKVKNSKIVIDKSKLPNQDSIPYMTLAEYNTLENKPKLWMRTDGDTLEMYDDKALPVISADDVTYGNKILKMKSSPYIDIGNSVTDEFDKLKEELNKMKENMTRQLNVTMLHGCRNCGAKIEVDINKPVFCCKYCGTSYIIGTVHQNSTY